MTEADLVMVLNGFVSSRVFPDAADANTPLPYIVWQSVGGQAFQYFNNEATDKKPTRVQIIVWAQTRLQANSIMRNIENALTVSPINARVEGALISRYEHDTLRGAMQDFSFWVTA